MKSLKIKILIMTGVLLVIDVIVGANAYAAFPAHQKDVAGVPAIIIFFVILVMGLMASSYAGRIEENFFKTSLYNLSKNDK